MRKLTLIILLLNCIHLTSQVFTTASQRTEVARRLADGWTDPDGEFPDIVARVKANAASFLADPAAGRFTNTDPNSFYRVGHDFPSVANYEQFQYAPQPNHVSAIYYCFDAAKVGWANQDPQYANSLFTELLWLANNPDLNFSNTTKFPRTQLPDQFPYTIIAGYIRQWILWYDDYIKPYETIAKATELARIENWIKGATDWAYDLIVRGYTPTLGAGWESITDYNYLYSIGWSNTKPSQLYDSNKNQLADFATTDSAAYIGNNRQWGLIGLCHIGAIYTKDLIKRNTMVQLFKNFFRWSIFPNGVPMEINRNSYPHNPSLFFGYFHEELQGLSELAFREQVLKHNGFIEANEWAWESLFEYTTTAGGICGKVIGNDKMWNGASTTDEVTPKGLLLFANAGVSFLDGTFDYYNSAGLRIHANNKKFPSAYGILNTYYNDPRIHTAEYLVNSAGITSGPPNKVAHMPILSGVFGSVNFPLGYIGMGGKVFKP